MRLLFVTYFFPPFTASASVRTGQTAAWLHALGHEVWVLSADCQPTEQDLPMDLPARRVAYTPWLGSRLEAFMKGRVPGHVGRPAAAAAHRGARALATSATRRAVRRAQQDLVYLPDDCIGWYPFGLRAALGISERLPFDLVYASAGPATSLLIASRVARLRGLPWVAELRDLWSDNHYRYLPPWYRRADAYLERRVLGTASGLVTVSEPWREVLEDRYRVPVEVVYNGFETPDRPDDPAPAGGGQLVITHLGTLYGGSRDPGPLFAAVRSLGADARHVRVRLYGDDPGLARRLAARWGVSGNVEASPRIPHAESLRVQSQADVLLLLMWDRPEEDGVLPGKLFEYFGAGRPVLVVGASRGAAARLVADRGLGFASSDPDEIAAQLRAWLAEKRAAGRLASPPSEAAAGFRRERQVRRLADFFTLVLEGADGAAWVGSAGEDET